MCGVVGIYALKDSLPHDRSLPIVQSMMDIIRYRGPDQSGIYIDDTIGIGHVRLSIIDLSGGCQPIHNEDKTIWTVFNGEIFNYQSLREQLLRQGHTFYTNTDTEVIVHMYEQYGIDCVNQMNGQFVIILYNSITKQVFIARDRVGIRPLFYCRVNDVLIFASEIKALFATHLVHPSFDAKSIEQVCTFWTTLPGSTLFSHIFELKPGHCIEAHQNSFNERKYWSIPLILKNDKTDASPDHWCTLIDEILYDAIALRMRADVPVGAYLSGGLDSAGLVESMKHNFDADIRTFGIRFGDEKFDEGAFQKLCIEALDVNHQSITASYMDISEQFPDVLWHCEKPLLRTAPVPLFMLSKLVKQSGVTVVMTGEGADEVFGGYNIFKEALIRRFWSRNMESSQRAKLVEYLYPNIFRSQDSKKAMQLFFGQNLTEINDPLFSHMLRWRNTSKIKQFYSPDFRQEIAAYDCFLPLIESLPEQYYKTDALTRAQYLEMILFMSGYLLSSQGDRVAMAHSIEIRMPYLDYRLIELVATIPSVWKILGLEEKFILKRVLRNKIPEQIIRRPKNPYRAPIHKSLVSHHSLPMIERYCNRLAVETAGICDYQKVNRLVQKSLQAGALSETEDMACAFILSIHILYDHFIRSFPFKRGTEKKLDICIDKRSS